MEKNVENQDKPGYKEEFKENYRVPFWICAILAIISALLYFFADDEFGLIACAFFAGAALLTFFYGLYRYRQDFKHDIKTGKRNKTWE